MGLMKKYYLIGIAGIIVFLAVGLLLYSTNQNPEKASTGDKKQETGASPAPTASGDAKGESAPKTGSAKSPSGSLQAPSERTSPTASKSQGRVIFALKDEFVSIDQINSILFTVNEIQIQNPGKGWVTVMTGPKVYDLVKIYKSGTMEFLSEVYLDPGTYNQLRMVVGKVMIIKKGSASPEEAKIPSGELKIPARLQITKGENSSVEIDILSEKSLHTATDGKYIFMPVVRVETRSNVTSFQVRQNTVTIIGGAPVYDASFGMDENGNAKDNYRLSPAAKLEIVDDKIKITPQ